MIPLQLLLQLAASCLLAGLPCSIQSSGGAVTKGELIGLDNAQAVLTVDGKEQRLAIDQIQNIKTEAPKVPAPGESVRIRLVDGSEWAIRDLTIQSGVMSLAPWATEASATQDLPRKGIHSVRFGAPSEELDPQWTEITTAEHAGDTLIIRKGADSLDFLEGVVLAMDATTVTFQYDEDKIPVKRTKLEGILFYQNNANDDQPEPALVATLTNGSKLLGDSMTIADGKATITTLSGLDWTTSVEALSNVDFAIGRTLFLSDAEPAEVTVTPHIASSLDAELTQLLYQPRRDTAGGKRPLQLRFPHDRETVTYSKGMCLHSRTEISYRLGNQYRTLQTVAGMDPQLGERGAVTLLIKADGDTLFEETIKGGAEPIDINLDVSNKRRVTIVVDYADKLDVADRLHLCELRVTK